MTTPLRAALLGRAFPGLRVLDLAVATGGLWPWWPGAVLALPDDRVLPAAERALLAGFGLGPPDPAFAVAAGPCLVVTPGDAAPWLRDGAMVLTEAGDPPPVPRILLLLGCGGAVAQASLLLPEGMLAAALTALSGAAQALAGAGWEWGARPVTDRLATLTLFAPAYAATTFPAAGLPCWREAPGRLRVLLGVLPRRPWRVDVVAEGARAIFLDGAPHDPATPVTPRPGQPLVLGIAGAGAVLHAVRLSPA